MKNLVSRNVGVQTAADDIGYFVGRYPGPRALGVQITPQLARGHGPVCVGRRDSGGISPSFPSQPH